MDKPWLQNYDKRVPPSLGYPVLPLDHFLLHAAHKYPRRTAVIYSAPSGSRLTATHLTYQQINQSVNHFAAGLQQQGVKKGDRVAIALPNCPQFVIAAFAAWRLGGIVVCLNPFSRPEDLAHMLDDSGSETLVITDRLQASVQAILGRTNLRQVIVSRSTDFLPWPTTLIGRWRNRPTPVPQTQATSRASTISFRSVLHGKMSRLKLVEVTPPDTAVILYPHPNAHNQPGVSMTHRNLVSSVTMLTQWLPLQPGQETSLAVMPFYDAFGLTAVFAAGIANAATLLLMLNPRDVGQTLQAIEQFRVTFLPGVPKLFDALIQQNQGKKSDLSRVRLALSSKSALTPALRQQFEAVTNGRLLNAYGLTEAGAVVALDPEQKTRPDTAGLPLPDTEVQIADVSFGTAALPIGEIGEIVVRGPQVMAGYWQRPEITAEVVRTGPDGRSGWLFTGDLGYLDSQGYLHVTTQRQAPIARGMNRAQL